MTSVSLPLIAAGIAVTMLPQSVAQAEVPIAPSSTAPVNAIDAIQKTSDKTCAEGAKPAEGACNGTATPQESGPAGGITPEDAQLAREPGQQALTPHPGQGSSDVSSKSASPSAATAGERKQQLLADAGSLLDQARLVDHDYAPGGDQASKSELEKSIVDMESDLDSMSQMGEMESLRLQMAMDRMSKMMATLSNILKKIDDTEKGIVQNMK
jgi:hypothetical protein